GSSAMPGKVNPVIPEFVLQSSIQVIACVTACGLAAEHSELDLNVWEGTYIHNLLMACGLVQAALASLKSRCLAGLQVNEEANRRHARVLTARIAKLVQEQSYQYALQQ